MPSRVSSPWTRHRRGTTHPRQNGPTERCAGGAVPRSPPIPPDPMAGARDRPGAARAEDPPLVPPRMPTARRPRSYGRTPRSSPRRRFVQTWFVQTPGHIGQRATSATASARPLPFHTRRRNAPRTRTPFRHRQLPRLQGRCRAKRSSSRASSGRLKESVAALVEQSNLKPARVSQNVTPQLAYDLHASQVRVRPSACQAEPLARCARAGAPDDRGSVR